MTHRLVLEGVDDPLIDDQDLLYHLIEEIKENSFVNSKDLALYLNTDHAEILKQTAIIIPGFDTEDTERDRPLNSFTVLRVVMRVLLDRMS